MRVARRFLYGVTRNKLESNVDYLARFGELKSVAKKGNGLGRLLSVAERTKYLFGKEESQSPVGRRKKKESQMQLDFMKDLQKAEREEGGWGEKNAPRPGETVLNQLHQAMILFAAGIGAAMKRFLVEEGIGRDGLFWRLAHALSALYPTGTDEKRWVDGVLARKKRKDWDFNYSRDLSQEVKNGRHICSHHYR